MRWPMFLTTMLLLAPGLLSAQQSPQKSSAEPQTGYIIRTDAREVVVDLIVRDKKGNPVRDLTAEEVKVLEADAPQQIVSFRKVEGGELERLGGAPGVEPIQEAAGGSGSQMRMAQLVTMVF